MPDILLILFASRKLLLSVNIFCVNVSLQKPFSLQKTMVLVCMWLSKPKKGETKLDKKLVGAFVVTLTALVFTVSLRYYTSTQSDQTGIPSPTPKSSPTPIPEETPRPTPIIIPADLVVNCTLEIFWADAPRLRVLGSITNVGTETAYNVTIHVRTWFSNGTEAITIDIKLSLHHGITALFYPIDIEGGETYRSGTLVGVRTFYIPHEICANWEEDYIDNDCISRYIVTASWDEK